MNSTPRKLNRPFFRNEAGHRYRLVIVPFVIVDVCGGAFPSISLVARECESVSVARGIHCFALPLHGVLSPRFRRAK